MEDRKITLLKACKDLLEKQNNSYYVLDLLSETVYYDGADCDGNCLLEDIKILLESEEKNKGNLIKLEFNIEKMI